MVVMAQKMKHTMGERLNIRFNRKIKLEFHGAKLTSDGGLLAYRELDEALGLFSLVSCYLKREYFYSIIHIYHSGISFTAWSVSLYDFAFDKMYEI